MKLSRDGKCILIALALGERIAVVEDHITVVMNGTAYIIDRVEFDYLEEKGLIAIGVEGCRITGRGRVWAKRFGDDIWGKDPALKAKRQRAKSLSRVRLRRGNRRGR